MAEPASEHLVWRIPPYQPALLMLVLCAAAALNIYAHPAPTARLVTLAFGLLCGALAVAALRLQAVADSDGIQVRHLTGDEWLPWPEVSGIEVVPDVRGAATVRLHRGDGRHVDIPPSLLQPGRPTSRYVAMRRLDAVVRQLDNLRKANQGRTGPY